jgi:DNA repair exonuclease SbcCD ATPase subunit
MKKYLLNLILLLVLAFSINSYVYARDGEDDSSSGSGKTESRLHDDEDESDDDKSFKEKMEERWKLREENQRRLEERKAKLLERKEKEDSERKGELEKKQREMKEEAVSKKCEELEERVTHRIENYQNNVDKHVENYTKLHTRLEEIIAKLSAKGFDVSKLESDLAQLEDMIQDYAGVYSGFIAKLTDAQELTCGEAEGAYRQALLDAQVQLKLAIEARQKIREFYAHTIRKDIQDLRLQKVNAHNDEAKGESDE